MTEYKIGQIIYADEDIIINEGRETISLSVANLGDRPIQVGSHFHFFESNRFLDFDREKSFGYRLDIPSGTAVRFEPGEKKTVTLTKYAGKQHIYGFNALTMGDSADEKVKQNALENARLLNFKGV